MICRLPGFILICVMAFGCAGKKQADAGFEMVDPQKSGVQFVNTPEEREGLNILYYLYYYNGGGVSAGDINNDGLPDIYFTANAKGKNKLYLNKGNFEFEDITEKAGVAGHADWCSGTVMADVNGDGYLDIYVLASSGHNGLQGNNELYLNNKNNSFTEASAQYGLNIKGFGTQAAFFDYDRDGDLDCYILNHSQRPHSNIKDTSYRHVKDTLAGDRLLRNDLATTGKFTDVSEAAGIYQSSLGYGLGISVADFNNDGWDDIYVGNDFHENDYYYLNNGDGSFTESGADHFGHYSRFSMGNDAGDFNNDGQMDLITVDMLPDREEVLKTYGSDENPDTYRFKLMGHGYQHQYSKNCLQRNNGNGMSYCETGLMSGISATDWSWSPLFCDFDNDGNRDLFISSGIVKRPVDLDYIRFVSDLVMKIDNTNTTKYDKQAIDKMPDGASHPYFYKGNGELRFEDMSKDYGTAGMKGYYTGAAYADFDGDNKIDIVINAIGSPAVLLKNKIATEHYGITIKPKGLGNNPFGIGLKAYLWDSGRMQYQQLNATHGFQSSSDANLYFGVGQSKNFDSLLLIWPNQKFQLLKNIPAIEKLVVEERFAGGKFNYDSFFIPKKPLLQDISKEVALGWRHKENLFYDYNKQYLIPHQLSTRGPKIAVADVNGDGNDDFYICGASGQAGGLFLQTGPNKFVQKDTALFGAAKLAEDVDALFFDANNDGLPDLYVACGGNTFSDGDPLLADRLYLNKGEGRFELSNSIPKILQNKSTVSVADIDKDGDMDLFIGVLANATQYGIAQTSYLLLNDGKANFSQAPPTLAGLEKLGMVTSSAFADINKDGWPDLLVAGEWMAVTLFINENGKFTKRELSASTGLWQNIAMADVNGDGSPDILAGNWGENSKLFAGKQSPLKLFVKDFDKNGSLEQLLTYNIGGTDYTFLCKDEIERAVPALKKHYLTYSEVAGKSVGFLFDDLFKDYVELKAEELCNVCFINDGKGNFSKMVLPDELQLAPIFTFTQLPSSAGWLAAGNFYGTIPYEGIYDALLPTAFRFSNNSIVKVANIPFVSGEVRDAKWIKNKNGGQVLVLALNDAPPLFLKNN